MNPLLMACIGIMYNILTVTNAEIAEAKTYGQSTGGNACGFAGPFTYFAATGGYIFDNGYQCGACYEITCIGAGDNDNCECKGHRPSVVVQIINQCYECTTSSPNIHFDLSTAARDAISNCGITKIEYNRVPCDYYNTNIKIRNKEGTNPSQPSWYALYVDDVAGNGAINSIQVKPSISSDWVTCTKPNGVTTHWDCGHLEMPVSLPLDVKFIDDSGAVLIAERVIKNFIPLYQFDTGVQY